MAHEQTRIEILRGTLDLLILRTLGLGPSHGHAIASQIKSTIMDRRQAAARVIGASGQSGVAMHPKASDLI